MSFFDEIETTVANSRFIQAKSDSEPVKLNLKPIEELEGLKRQLSASKNDVTEFLKKKTFGEYIFTKFLKKRGHEEACEFLNAILLGLEHMHSFDIIYRDMKPHNMLLNSDGHVIISDLGLTIKIRPDKPCRHLAGTAGYWAPEIISKKGTYKTSDYWSWAVLVHEMLSGSRPRSKAKGKLEWSPFGQSRTMEENAQNEQGVLVLDMDWSDPVFVADPTVVDLLKKIFKEDHTKRLGANGVHEIKEHPYFNEINWEQLERLEMKPPYIPNKDKVYAQTIGEVGEFNQGKFRKMKITPEDDKYYADWAFISEEGIQAELAQALYKIDNPPLASNQTQLANHSSCCTLL
jgi:beta-adrenergic-receptor kinase